MKVLSQDEIRSKLGALGGWMLTPDGIRKRYELDSFMSVIHLVNRVAEAAEKANHHPDMLINYNKVTFTLMTHDAGGITQKDLDLATGIEAMSSN
jgi:4a-hydroxytetrahydrobiopterin dehydratase